MTKEQIKQKAEAEADKVIIGSGMDRASVIHLKHLLVTMYIQGATEATKELKAQIEKMKCWHNMYYNDKESCKKIPRGIQLLTEYDCGLFVAYCVNKWTGDHWVEHSYGITRWKEIEAK